MDKKILTILSKILEADYDKLANSIFRDICVLLQTNRILVYRAEPQETISKLFLSYSPKLIHPLMQIMPLKEYAHLFNKSNDIKDTMHLEELKQSMLDAGDTFFYLYPVFRENKALYIFCYVTSKEKVTWREDLIGLFSTVLALKFGEEKALELYQNESFMLSTASHEIRTQIGSFIGIADLLTRTKLDKPQKKKVTLLQQGAENMLQTLNSILDYGKLKAGKIHLQYVPFDFAEMINSISEMFIPIAEKNHTQLTCDLSKLKTHHITSDPGRLKRIIFNLVSNAIKFTNNGKVKISAESNDKHKLITVTVSDTGVGIPETMKDLLFKEYQQADTNSFLSLKGTGLGLSISYKLIKRLGGKIDWESKEGKGTKFWFEVPYSPVEDRELSPFPLKILLVDDEPINTKLTASFLTKLGHYVTIAETAKDALFIAHENTFDLMLLDLHLPDESGYELFTKICQLKHHVETPIYAFTASADSSEEASCLNKGFKGVVEKPFSKDALKDILYKICSEKKQRFSDTEKEDAIFDLSVLVNFRNSIGPEGFQNLVSEFLLHSYNLVMELNAITNSENYAEIYRISHNLKSAAKAFGLTGLASRAERIEKLSKTEAPEAEEFLALLKKLEKEYNKSTMLLQQYTQENT